MILASLIGIFAIPPLYVTFQAMREKLRPSSRPKETQSTATPIEPAHATESRRPSAAAE
jgi:hypothetical protein